MPGDDPKLVMARRIADDLIPNPENESVVYKSFHQTAMRAALAAMEETTEADCSRPLLDLVAEYANYQPISDDRWEQGKAAGYRELGELVRVALTGDHLKGSTE